MMTSERPDYAWLNQVSINTLKRGYLAEGIPTDQLEQAAKDRAMALVDTAEQILWQMWSDTNRFVHRRDRSSVKTKLDTLRHGIKRGWVSPASPIWSNFGTPRALPISCNGSYLDDTTDSILWKTAEIGMMTKQGAGTSAYMGALRPNGSAISGGGKSLGQVHFGRLIQEHTTVISQANVRRGNCALYFDIDSPEIDDILKIRDLGHPLQHVSFGVNITDAWMEAMLAEPKGGDKRKLMARIVNKRRATGFPYLVFIDTANQARPRRLKEIGLRIQASNLCTEIFLHSTPDESFVCDLSSLNLLYYDEWKNTDLVEDMIYFLDAVMTEYIKKAQGERLMADAVRFAVKWRALGLGTLGWHSLLQSKMIPFESDRAKALNIEVHRQLGVQSFWASAKMAQEYGEAPGMAGAGRRHLTTNAIAPTTSSSIILGQVSQSIEPWDANIFENDNAKGVFTQRNPFLEKLLNEKGRNTTETWQSILQAGGSVQHLEFLTDREKAIFKTFLEIDQNVVIEQAADRQFYIDQGQSLNLKIHPDASMKENVDLIVKAWKLGIKSLYYHKGLNKAQELARQSCVACEA